MQAKMIREAKRLIRDYDKKTRKTRLVIEVIPPGTLIQGEKVHILCLQGIAVPHDKECRERVQMTDEQLQNAIILYDKAELGITKDDEEAFDRGLMKGYLDNQWIPGPNYYEGAEDDYYNDEEDDDDE